MFDITPDDITRLNDVDLRELVARLSEAELAGRGHSPAAVTWGGNQTASDGGLDVRVTLVGGDAADAFIPRASTGFQVKKPDMPRGEILSEMKPQGAVREVIQRLAAEGGAYVIVSSTGSTSDSALRSRRLAMREAVAGMDGAENLHTDFYDRTRLATWVRQHAGLIAWVRARVGRSLVGWRPFGAWSGAAAGESNEYLIDEKLRLHQESHRNSAGRTVVEGIDEIRDMLAQPGWVVRLVGLSGVGKTRFAEALFDPRIGKRPLHTSLAVYTNLSDHPDPQPIGLASDLIASRSRAILVVDNCPPDLHSRLTEVCRAPSSSVSVLTVEYDVRDDQPEGTQVVRLDTSSPELVEKLVRRRYADISQVDARTIADTSGGNARMAIALAETVTSSDSIAGLSSDELFQRLFRQRHDQNDALLHAARACSLVYSFEGEALSGDQAELSLLANLAGQTAIELFRHVGELARRELVQQRAEWRAMLPHAIANRLAAQALEDIPFSLINQILVHAGSSRLARSLSRRLSFLHDHPRAASVVGEWLAADGYLGDIQSFDDTKRAMFENVSAVLPEASLSALERASDHAGTPALYRPYLPLLRSLAYEPSLFARSMRLISIAAMESEDDRAAKEASDVFLSLFPICLSGTHATVGQRLEVVESLLRRDECQANELGIEALDRLMEAVHFSSGYRFDFGARSRDYGFEPTSVRGVREWYGAVINFLERAYAEGLLKTELRDVLARNLRGLWISAGMSAALDKVVRLIAADGFWRDGWIASRQILKFDGKGMPSDIRATTLALERTLRPSSLEERVRAFVLGNSARGFDIDDFEDESDITASFERLEASARELGRLVAADSHLLEALLPDLVRGGTRAWSFGSGLAEGSDLSDDIWRKLSTVFGQVPVEQRNVQVFRGFLAEVWARDKDLGHQLLDAALADDKLAAHSPALHSAVQLDSRCVERLRGALRSGHVPLAAYRNLAYGRATDALSGAALSLLLNDIESQPDGSSIAVEMLDMHIHAARTAKREVDVLTIQCGRDLLRRVHFRKGDEIAAHHVAELASACLSAEEAAEDAAALAVRLKYAVHAGETYSFHNSALLEMLLKLHPHPVLDALFPNESETDVEIFDHIGDARPGPADVIPSDVLVAWCNRNPDNRYPVAASIVTFARRPQNDAPIVWSEQATGLMTHAPDPQGVLKAFVARFSPMSWSGSRASIMEANGRLLDCLPPSLAANLSSFVAEARSVLQKRVESERAWETKHDRARDERFE